MAEHPGTAGAAAGAAQRPPQGAAPQVAARGSRLSPPADPKYNWPTSRSPCSARRSSGSTVRTRSPAARSTPSTSTVPGMLYGRIVRSPHPHARDRVDRSVGGAEGAGRQGGARRGAIRPTRSATRVMFQGDEVAAVAADTEEHAIDAARLVKVEYEVLPHVIGRRTGAGRQRAGGLHRRQRAPGRRRRKPAISRPASSRRRTRSRRPTRRTSSRTSASSRTARCASGTATS